MMTIKELEEAVGMTRANIRFYEQEGLLSPARSANGYRDYSPEDAAALEKIKLLRRLHLDLNTLRRLQAGELTLAEALEKQLGQLGRDQSALDRARAVCAQLRAAGTEYQQLDAHPWLEELDRAPASERFAPPADELPPAPGHPWRRYFARMLDLALYGLPITAVEVLVLHLSPNLTSKAFIALLEGYLGFALMFLLEPLLLHYWGTTPGKLLFGIVLRDADGSPLSLSDARKRLSLLFFPGPWLGHPHLQSVSALQERFSVLRGRAQPLGVERLRRPGPAHGHPREHLAMLRLRGGSGSLLGRCGADHPPGAAPPAPG